MNLILVDAGEVSSTGVVRLSGSHAAHLRNVLRVAVGYQVRVGILDGPCGTGKVQSVEQHAIELQCHFEGIAPARPRIDLLLALPRPKVLRRLWAQLAALGVGRILLTNAERVERDYFDTHVLTPECYRPLLIEGLQQARDTRVPVVSVHRRFKVLLEDQLDDLCGSALRAVAEPAATADVGSVVRGRGDGRVLLAIGPEGGWNAFEIGLLQAHRFRPVGMGARTLRTDTACIALLALVHDALGATG